MRTILEELAAGRVFCDRAGVRQFACFGPRESGRERVSPLLFPSWTGMRETLWHTSYGDEDYDRHSQ